MRSFIALLLLAICQPAYSALVSHTGTIDTWVPGTGHANSATLQLGTSKQVLINFTATPPTLPTGAGVKDATIILPVAAPGAATVDVKPILQSWTAGQSRLVSVGNVLDTVSMAAAGTRHFDVSGAWPNANGYALTTRAGGADTALQSNEGTQYSLRVTYHTAGDVDRNSVFNQNDLLVLLQGGKYLTGQAASWEQGDFNGDGLFNQADIQIALIHGNYAGQGQNAFGQNW